MVVRDVRRRPQQPRQQGTVDETHTCALPSRLEKDDGNDILGILGIGNEPVRVATHA